MINVSVVDYAVLIAFWLSFSRWAAILVQLPLFDNTSVPNLVKVLMSLVISYAFFPVVKGTLGSRSRQRGRGQVLVAHHFSHCCGPYHGLPGQSHYESYLSLPARL